MPPETFGCTCAVRRVALVVIGGSAERGVTAFVFITGYVASDLNPIAGGVPRLDFP